MFSLKLNLQAYGIKIGPMQTPGTVGVKEGGADAQSQSCGCWKTRQKNKNYNSPLSYPCLPICPVTLYTCVNWRHVYLLIYFYVNFVFSPLFSCIFFSWKEWEINVRALALALLVYRTFFKRRQTAQRNYFRMGPILGPTWTTGKYSRWSPTFVWPKIWNLNFNLKNCIKVAVMWHELRVTHAQKKQKRDKNRAPRELFPFMGFVAPYWLSVLPP
jgi:hypothetical protein